MQKKWIKPEIKVIEIGIACNKKFPQFLKCEADGIPSEGTHCTPGGKPATLT